MSKRLRGNTAIAAVGAVAGLSVAAFGAVIGVTEVPLNGSTVDVRRIETNLGNLVAHLLTG